LEGWSAGVPSGKEMDAEMLGPYLADSFSKRFLNVSRETVCRARGTLSDARL
jgi:hypothetical protein